MKTRNAFLVFVVAACLVADPDASVILRAAPADNPANTAASAPLPWPRTFDAYGAHIIVYQPQLKSWRNFRTLVADTAVSITPKDDKPVLGVISFEANTLTNVSTRTVVINDVKILDARFPSLDPAHEAAMQQRVHEFYPTMTLTISIDRMIASLKKVNAPSPTVATSTEVPTIFYSESPAIVLLVDGKPVLAPIQGTTIEYVVNTTWDLFYDKSDYFLLDGKTWLKSKELNGRWSVATRLPADLSKLPPDQNWGDVLKAIPPAGGAQKAPESFSRKNPPNSFCSMASRFTRRFRGRTFRTPPTQKTGSSAMNRTGRFTSCCQGAGSAHPRSKAHGRMRETIFHPISRRFLWANPIRMLWFPCRALRKPATL